MVRLHVQIAFALIFVFLAFDEAFSKEWRGIAPLRSTREDVVRALNQCKDSNPSCEFTIDNEFVHIEFSGDGQFRKCGPQVKQDTVLLVEVFPKAPLSMKKSGFESRRFRMSNLSGSTKAYLDEEAGLVLKVQDGKIVQLDYIAALVDRRLCSSYYENPIEFVQDIFASHIPVIYVTCPSEPVRAGHAVKVSADFAGKSKISFLWTLTGGQIVSGQGTPEITIDTAGFEGRSIVATAKLGRVQSSCEIKVRQD